MKLLRGGGGNFSHHGAVPIELPVRGGRSGDGHHGPGGLLSAVVSIRVREVENPARTWPEALSCV